LEEITDRDARFNFANVGGTLVSRRIRSTKAAPTLN